MPPLDHWPRRRLLAVPLCALSLGALPAVTLAAPASPRTRTRPPPRAPLPLVVLDPGHGGKDPGAIGPAGTYEKHIAFAAAQELRRQLLAAGRCRVALTRGRDVFIPLPDRVAIAQHQRADLFVSLHADALPDHTVRGASVYTLSETPSDPQSAALARRENAVDRLAPGLPQVPPDIARILSSLIRQETRLGSAQAQRSVVDALAPRTTLLPGPARHAGFAVLKAAEIPSILVEMGFMSNPADEAALRTTDHRARLASALRAAIEQFLATGNRAVRVAQG